MRARTLWLDEAEVRGDRVTATYGVDHHRFHTTLRWEGLDLDDLAQRIGPPVLRRIVFHIAAFEAMKGASLRPDRFDLGPYADLGTASFRRLWSTVQRHVWAQWRYQHGQAQWSGPAIAGDPAPAPDEPVTSVEGPPRTLLFCGGGKDSLLAGRLLDEAGVPYATYAYAHTVYGPCPPQHELIDGLVGHLGPECRHRHWVEDDLLGMDEAHRTRLGIGAITAAETPASVFGALPLALAEGYSCLVLGHERSADAANLVWDVTGEPVNHQWGKSLEAEVALRDHISGELVSGLSCSSVLKPAHDVLIFRALAEHTDAIAATHSCNVAKPWCLRCAKCAYVWLGYRAFLPAEVCDATFGDENLLDVDLLRIPFEQLLGLADHTPFECIGQVDETRLFFEILRRRGHTGAAMRMYEDRVGPVDAERLYAELVAVDPAHHAMPPHLAAGVVPALQRMAALPLG